MKKIFESVRSSLVNFLSSYPRITGWAVFLGIFSFMVYLSWTEYQISVSNEREQVKSKLNELENAVLFSIRNSISAAKTLAFFSQKFDVVEDFDSIGRQILENNPNVDVIQYLDSGTIVAVYPLEGNETVIGYNVAEDPRRRMEVQEALTRKDIYFSGPFSLLQGGVGIVGRYPILYQNGELKGFSATIIYLNTLVKNARLENPESSLYILKFSKKDENTGEWVDFLGDSNSSESYSGYEQSVLIPEGNWQLSVQLKESQALNGILPSLLLRMLTAVLFGLISWNFARIPSILKRKVEEQSKDLKIANQRFELAAKASSDFIWDWDLETDTTYRSNAFYESFGYDQTAIKSNNNFWLSIIHPNDLAEVTEDLEKTLASNSTFWSKEFRIKDHNDNYHFILDKGYILRNEKGKAVRIIGATQDITSEKLAEIEILQANEKLSSANEELKAFASLASHDMREPLRMISSFMDLLEKKYHSQLDDKARQYIFFARDGAKRLTQMIADLLEYSKAGFDVSKSEEIDTEEVLKEVLELKSDIIRKTGARVSYADMPMIRAQKIPVKILFQNLIGNSLKYIHPDRKPEIEIKGEDEGDFWKFHVKDNGIGIESDYLEEIFGILKRLHPKEKYPGTGMGLATCRKIVTQFGGKIWAESKHGEGTTLSFTIKKL